MWTRVGNALRAVNRSGVSPSRVVERITSVSSDARSRRVYGGIRVSHVLDDLRRPCAKYLDIVGPPRDDCIVDAKYTWNGISQYYLVT